jgi:hypothetical protein
MREKKLMKVNIKKRFVPGNINLIFGRINFLSIFSLAAILISIFSILIVYRRNMSNEFQYRPADIVYGEKIYAVHEIDKSNSFLRNKESAIDISLKPVLSLSEKYYDFGVVDTNQIVTRTFVIANIGKSPLVIFHAYSTCSCIIADFTADEIPSGKVILMTLKFDSGFHNLQNTTIRRGVILETNDPEQPTQEIWIQAKVR